MKNNQQSAPLCYLVSMYVLWLGQETPKHRETQVPAATILLWPDINSFI